MNLPPRTLHRCRISIAVLALAGARCDLMAAGPLPSGAQVVSGNARIGAGAGSSLDVVQSSQRAVVNWNSFSIGAGNQVRFIQPNAGSATLNRVVGATPSTIAGTLSANGQVFLVNPNGIAITPNGIVDVGGGFIASTLSITDQDFQAGVLRFSGSGASARLSQDGTIRTQSGGSVVLLGGSVSNSGVVRAPLGKIMVGSGEMATLDLHGDGMLQVALPSTSPPANGGSRIDIGGTLQADGGRVWVGAATAAQAWRDVVNVSGEIVARSVSGRDGAIVLEAGPAGAVNVTGQLVASGDRSAGDIHIGGAIATVEGAHAALIARSDSGHGGNITVAPQSELTMGSALLDVSGATGGGTIRLGGDAQGAGNLVHADRSFIGPDTRLIADATRDGTGGRVIVWSDARTDFLGQISARGAGLQGAGGFAEVSSHGLLRFAGNADLRGAPGHTGNLLLDPFDVTISTAANSNHDASFSATGNDSVVNVTTLQNALATANVTVSTGSTGSQVGDITVASAVAWNSGNTLTLSAARDINVNANVTSNGGALTLNAGRGVTVTGATINTSGGNLIATANTTDGTSGLKFDGATLDVGNGTGTLTGNSSTGFGVRFLGLPSTLRASGSGSITLGGNSTSSHGIVVDADLATSGPVTINGTSDSAFGIDFRNTAITTSGNLAFNGTSNTSNAVWVLGSTLSLSTTGSGTLSVQGTSSNFNGIRLNAGAALTTSGAVQLSGTSLNGGGGLSLVGSNTITVASGNTTITGTATSPFNAIDMASSGNSVTNNGAGALTLAGNGNISLAAPLASPSGSLAINASGDLLLNTGTQITWPTGSTQTLSAGRDIKVNAAISGNGGLQLNAGRDIGVTANLTTNGGALGLNASGAVSINSATLDTGGGTLNITGTTTDPISAGISLKGVTINAGSGTINGSSDVGNGLFFLGTAITTSGNLSISGVADSNNAVWVEAGTLSLASTGAGVLSLQGTSNTFRGIRMNTGTSLVTDGTVQLSGTSLVSNAGFSLKGSNTITVASGNTTITGTATSPFNAIDIASGGNSVTNNGVGALTIAGIGNVVLAAPVTSPLGSLAINATGDLLLNTGTQITWPTGSAQTLSAGRDINVNAAITGSGGLQLNAGRDITINSNVTASGGPLNVGLAASPTAGTITINNATIDTGGGNLGATATQSGAASALRLFDATLNVGSGSGALTVAADGNGTFASGNLALLASGGGSITLGTTGNTGSGLFFNTNAALTTTGTVSVSGASASNTGLYFLGTNSINAGGGSLSLNGSSATNTGVWFNGGINTLVATGGLSINGTSTGYRGLGLNSGVSLAATGDVALAGTSAGQQGLWFNGTNGINANNGTFTLTGNSGSGEGVFIDLGANSFAQSGTGAITLSGNSTAASGVLFNASASLGTNGKVTLNGSSVNGPGVALTGGNALTAGSGTLAVNGGSASSSGVQFSGADSLTNAGGSITVTGASSTGAGLGLNAGAALTTTGNLTLSGSGSSTGISLATGAALDNTGSGTLHLVATTGGIDLGADLVSPNGALWLTSTGNVTQGSGSITASQLRLSGSSGSYELEAPGNQVQTVAANAGSVALHSGSGLTIGTVLGVSGATTTGKVTFITEGDLAIASGATVSGASPVLAAGANFINHSGADAIKATSGRWLVYAADPASSVFSGLDSGNTALWSATHASRLPGSVFEAGNRYLFAIQPVLTATSTDASKVYGDDVSSAIASSYTVTGLHGGVSNAFLGDTAGSAYAGAPAVSSIGSASTAGVNAAPYAIVVSQGSLSSSAGYGFAFVGTGRLTITPRPLAFVANPVMRPFGQANPPLLGTVAGFVNGDSLGGVATGKLVWATPADATSSPGTYSIFGSGLSVTSLNYTLAQDPGNAFALTVTPRTLSIVAPPDGVKSTTRAFAENAGAYCVLGPLLTRSEQTRCKLDSDAVRMPVLQEQDAELP